MSAMLVSLPVEEARMIYLGLTEANYTEAGLRLHLGSVEVPARYLRNEARLLDRTREPSRLNSLLRWFWLGRPVSLDQAADTVPAELRSLLLKSHLLRHEGDALVSDVMLLPLGELLVAADHPSSFLRNEKDLVLWPNPTSRFLGRFTVRQHSRATLDLGTGSGILSLWAAKHSDVVVATDLNARAASFVDFNARLNGVQNIEILTGASFEPVAGRKFDLIVCNPPFFITPRSEYLFCDNPMDLDYLCRQLIREAPSHLNEGGYLEMLCEWAQVEGEPWEDRVAEWLDASGCDAWVTKGNTQAPEEYAQHRIKEKYNEEDQDAELYDSYMSYYRERKVEAIHDGLIIMRKRTGKNWVSIEEVPKTPTGNLGDVVVSTFAAHDYLQQVESDDLLLDARPRLAANARLEQVCEQSGSQWKANSLTLRLASGFPFHVSVQPLVAEFLVACDGNRTVRQVVEAFATAANAPAETVRKECLGMLRKLIERGFVVPEASPAVVPEEAPQYASA